MGPTRKTPSSLPSSKTVEEHMSWDTETIEEHVPWGTEVIDEDLIWGTEAIEESWTPSVFKAPVPLAPPVKPPIPKVKDTRSAAQARATRSLLPLLSAAPQGPSQGAVPITSDVPSWL